MSGQRALRSLMTTGPAFADAASVGRASPAGLPMLPQPGGLSVMLASLAVLLQLVVSSNLLSALGIQYDQPGGSILVKFHPSTYLVVLALVIRLAGTGRPIWALQQVLQRFAAVSVFIALFIFCIVYAIATQGPNGASIYVESYVSAGLLLLVLGDAEPSQLRRLGGLMLALFLVNVVLAIGETVLHRHLLPQYQGAILNPDILSEFRGLALYDHALTGAMMTQMALFLLLAMRLPPWLTGLLGATLLVGLLAFGGRTAQLVSAVTLMAFGAYFMTRGLVRRSISPGAVILAITGFVVVVFVMWLLLTQTALGVRTAGKLAFNDASTQARSVQWMVPGLLTFGQLMFGISAENMLDLIFQLALTYPFIAIENFWLVAFLNFGVVGFAFYLAGFGILMWHLWRTAPLFGRAVLVTTIIVASTSISLGKKSNLLFVATATICATIGYRRRESPAPLVSTDVPQALAVRREAWAVVASSAAPTDTVRALRAPALSAEFRLDE